jgi:hypothetical protein
MRRTENFCWKWIILHTSVACIVKVVTLRKARWVGRVARKAEKIRNYKIFVEKISEKVPTCMNEEKKSFPVGP